MSNLEAEIVDKSKENDEKVDDDSPVKKSKHDISEALRLTDHITSRYPNGMTLGVRLEAVPGTRGVHVDIVFVLDLREAAFGKGGLAMRSAVLETVNRDLTRVLGDVGLDEFLREHTVITPWGRIRLPLLRGMANDSTSLIHETRTVYVITENAKPSVDLTWLTDAGRIITADQFVLIRQSDARSRLPDLKKTVESSKWQLLERGLTKGWFGVLSLLALAIGVSSVVSVVLAGSGSLLLPIIASAASGVIGGWLLRSSKSSVISFQETIVQERNRLRAIGDSTRITKSIEENEDKLHLIGDLNFIVSPLIATIGPVISKSDVDGTVNIACSVLDECVRLAPKPSNSSSLIRGDDGLRKFIGLFEHLGGNVEETDLALAYVGLTGHLTKPITFPEAVQHLTELNNALYDIGALRPDIKENVDDHLNMIALKEAVVEIDKEMAKETDIDLPEVITPVDEEIEPEEPVAFESTDVYSDEDDIHDLILHASVEEIHASKDEPDESEMTGSDGSEEIKVVGADIVAGRMKKRKIKPKETAQLSLFDDYEMIRAGSETKEESGSAGA